MDRGTGLRPGHRQCYGCRGAPQHERSAPRSRSSAASSRLRDRGGDGPQTRSTAPTATSTSPTTKQARSTASAAPRASDPRTSPSRRPRNSVGLLKNESCCSVSQVMSRRSRERRGTSQTRIGHSARRLSWVDFFANRKREPRRFADELGSAVRVRVLALDEPVAWDDWNEVSRRSFAMRFSQRTRVGIGAGVALSVVFVSFTLGVFVVSSASWIGLRAPAQHRGPTSNKPVGSKGHTRQAQTSPDGRRAASGEASGVPLGCKHETRPSVVASGTRTCGHASPGSTTRDDSP
jgi:hypothetical protein